MTEEETTIASTFAEHRQVLDAVERELAPTIADVARRVRATFDAGGTLFFCGNGGSAADAQHLAAEYVVRFSRERRPVPAIALTTDTSILTAASNDYGFERVFERQLLALGRPGDLLFVHSTSGESQNLVRVSQAARDKDIATVGLLGKGGGRLATEVDLPLVVPGTSTARAQEMHLLIGHIVCDLVEAGLAANGDSSG